MQGDTAEENLTFPDFDTFTKAAIYNGKEFVKKICKTPKRGKRKCKMG